MSAPPRIPSTSTAAEPAAAAGHRAPAARKLSFDVLRVAFVLLVVLYHATFIGPLVYQDMIPRNWVFAHQVGASLLLVLSAYFVAATVRKHGTRDGSGRWWWGKIARLLPAFVIATIAAFCALRFAAPDGWYLPTNQDLVANLLMLWQWNGIWQWDYVDGSYWTIPLQLMAFTLAAFLWRTPLGRGVGLRALMWFALLAPLAQWWLRVHQENTLYAALVDGFGLHRWHLFVVGVAVWLFATGRIGRAHITALLATAMVAHTIHGVFLTPEGTLGIDPYAAVGVSLGMLALLLAAVGPDWAPLVPARLRPTISWLAGISYGVFLVHQTLGYVFMRRIQELGAGPTLQTVAVLVAATAAGWLLTRLVERPAHRRLVRAWDAVAGRARRPQPPDQPETDGSDALATAPIAMGSGARSSRS